MISFCRIQEGRQAAESGVELCVCVREKCSMRHKQH